MIYQYPPDTDPIKQGDIFKGIPRVDISLREFPIAEGEANLAVRWLDVYNRPAPIKAILPISSIIAIVASQNCDCVRSNDITLCEIRAFADLFGSTPSSPKKWMETITQKARTNLKRFYLPSDERLGFNDRMGVDFLSMVRVPRLDLEGVTSLRIGRLNQVAYEHFRELISEFFRRYPYDEWYSLDKEEFKTYKAIYPDTPPFSWQAELEDESKE